MSKEQESTKELGEWFDKWSKHITFAQLIGQIEILKIVVTAEMQKQKVTPNGMQK